MQHPVLMLLLIACSSLASAAERPIRLDIAAGKVGEVCMPLEAGATLAWHFEASAPVDFNLHHHVGNDVLLAVERKAVAQDRAQHIAERRNDWCLMWSAPASQRISQRITVRGGWRVKR